MRTLLCLILCLVFIQVAKSAVLGIDYGSDYMVVAIIRPGSPVEAALDFNSKRKTPTAILFEESSTNYGYDALGAGARKPGNVLNHLSRFVAQGPESEYLGYFKSLGYPFEFVPNNRTTYDVKFPKDTGFKDIETLSSEEVSGLLLEYAKTIGEHADDGNTIKDVVISVPSFWTHHQRVAIKNAARLAGLNVLSLIDYSTSAALHYSINKIFPNSTQKVMFYDMGASSTQVTIAEYSTKVIPKQVPKRYFRILAKTWDEFLGGNNLDQLLMKYFVDEFEKETKLSVEGEYKPLFKFRQLAKKYKEILTVNERIPVHEGGIFQDKDFSLLLQRSLLTELSSDFAKRVAAPALKALEDANLSVGDLYGVEIIGGGVRVPLVQKALREALHKETLDTHLNGDETVAFGAAFRAANLSRAFKTRFIGMTDYNPYSIKLHLYRDDDLYDETKDDSDIADTLDEMKNDFIKNKGSEGYTIDLFKKGGNYKSQKNTAFHVFKDFNIHVYYGDMNQISKGNVPTIYRYRVQGVEDALAGIPTRMGDPNITLSFLNDHDGTLFVRDPYMKIRYEAQEEVEIEEPVNELHSNTTEDDSKMDETKTSIPDNSTEHENTNEDNNESTSDNNTEETTPKSPEDDVSQESNTTENETPDETQDIPTNSTETVTNSTDVKKEKPKTIKKKIMVTKTKIRRIKLNLIPVYLDNELYIHQLNEYEFKASQEKLASIRRANEKKREHGKAVNDFEAYIYYGQQRITEDDYIAHAKEGEIEKVEALLDQMDEWFTEEADDKTPTRVYKEKYLEMKALVEVVENRIAEEQAKIEKEKKEKEEAERKKKEEEEAKIEKEKKEKEEAEKKEKGETEKKEEETEKKENTNTEPDTKTNTDSNEKSTSQDIPATPQFDSDDYEKMSAEEQREYVNKQMNSLKQQYADKLKKEGKYDDKDFDKQFNDLMNSMKQEFNNEEEL